MFVILAPNPNPPYNLRQIIPSAQVVGRFDTEALACAYVVSRNLAVGQLLPGAPYWIVDDRDLPGGSLDSVESTDFFDAWEWGGTSAVVNMPRARGIHLDRIRVVRNAKLQELDITWMKAVESGDTAAQAAIAKAKQILRDIPTTFDLVAGVDTPTQLHAKWPAELGERGG